jgi:thymidylate kinase
MKKARGGMLISVDGMNGAAVKAAARETLSTIARASRGGISCWDASGVFDELLVADDEAGAASARTLLLLYAADLAFRLRWEIRPALAEGRVVIAAPYVETAIAFGRAAGVKTAWLTNLLAFAPRPARSHYVDKSAARVSGSGGFIELASGRIVALPPGTSRETLAAKAGMHLRAAAGRGRRVARVRSAV